MRVSLYPKTRRKGRCFAAACGLAALCFAAAAAFACLPLARAAAQAGGLPIIRDAEAEALISDYAAPLLKAAKQPADIRVIIVNDDSFNAFADGRRIFINSGALLQAETPNEIIGVLAHEIGHLAGGHQYRLRDRIKQAQTLSAAGMLLGLGAGIAGSGAAGGGIMAGSQELALRTLLSYQRSEETAADRSAIAYLNQTGQSAKGMLDTFARFANRLALEGMRPDPYRQSHPLPQARIEALKSLAEKSPYYHKKDASALQLRHNLMRAKFAAYQRKLPLLRRLSQDKNSLPARYGQAVLALTGGTGAKAALSAQALIKEMPQNPYFHELLGDDLLKANQAGAAAQAYKQAIAADKYHSPLLYISYARALLATDKAADRPAAIAALRSALRRENDDPETYGFLAMALSRAGKPAAADLATADMHYYSGNLGEARYFALRARQGLKRGSAEWLRAQDILNIAQTARPGRR